MRLVAAEAGFLPPGPCTVFADIAFWRFANRGQFTYESSKELGGVARTGFLQVS
jgi:hypothetical protein